MKRTKTIKKSRLKSLAHKTPRDPTMRYITRIDNDRGGRGWLIRMKIGLNPKSKFVADGKDTRQQSLAKAQKIRNNFLRQHVAVTIEAVTGE